MILTLTDVNNTIVYINSEHIIRFNRVDNQTAIRLSDGHWFSVKEDPEYICTKINDWGK